ncbi:MAG: glycosyltransferase family 4 protein [Planctomycetes bacterium]|nr:glycosyltransferase family 4 protein [Planctomycetota bacterium]
MSLVSTVGLAVRAVQIKLGLLTAYDTFWPAAVRGSRLLLNGQVSAFTRKLFNELPDARETIPVEANRSGPPLFLAGHVLGLGGYDHLVLNILKGLTNSGVNVCRDRRSCFRKQLVPIEIRPSEMRRRAHHPRLAVAPPYLLQRYSPDRHTAAFTMWESDTLPPGSVEQLNRCGLVIVPSSWGRRCFRANGVRVPIEVVSLGYDPTVFGGTPSLARGVRQTVFGTAGALDEGGLRKNVQRVIDLFRQEFPSERDVRLRVKITPNSPRVETHGDPRVEVLDSHLTPSELADWYRSLNVYVNASAGEGFGLHLLEAMACGVPLISSRFGGVGAFFDARVGYEVRSTPIEASNAIYQGMWSDPHNGDMMTCMRQVYRDGETARLSGIAASQRAAKFRWEDTMRKLVIALIRHNFIRHPQSTALSPVS